MTPFRLTHEFAADPPRFWKVFFDKAYNQELYERIEVKSYEILAWREDDATLYRSIRIMPRRELPLVVRKLTGADLGYTENSTLYKAEDRMPVSVVPSTLADRTTIEGVYSLRSLGPGRLLRTFEGGIEIDVPLVGRRVERAILDDLTASYAKAAQLTTEWLARA